MICASWYDCTSIVTGTILRAGHLIIEGGGLECALGTANTVAPGLNLLSESHTLAETFWSSGLGLNGKGKPAGGTHHLSTNEVASIR